MELYCLLALKMEQQVCHHLNFPADKDRGTYINIFGNRSKAAAIVSILYIGNDVWQLRTAIMFHISVSYSRFTNSSTLVSRVSTWHFTLNARPVVIMPA